MSTEPCPLCGRPIPDTAYVCDDCASSMSSRLNRAAELWESVEDTVGHLAQVEGTSPIRGMARPDWIGPFCRSCDHDSCFAIWKSSTRLRKVEPAGVREEKGLLDLDAFENSWIVGNTATAWADHVAQHRGNRPQKMPPIGGQVLRPIPDRPERCVYSDLPIEQCACGRAHKVAS